MSDEIFDRSYQEGRQALHDGITELAAKLGRTFRLIAAVQFRAPWRNRPICDC
ncbi:hypothetical protein [Sphingomonas xanthus]|uniref:hypothetical protein n=1 Tax=Sphingomonas xanthus TaxID=2594473 RepID=UPI00164E614D|nr:hypothetical protein [Sphingomonas xanthus]